MTRPRKIAEVMFPLMETYLHGQQKQKAFCSEHDISISMLGYWLAKYRRQHTEKPSAFMDIMPVSAPEGSALMEIVYPHGVRLRLFAPVRPAYLASLLTPESSSV